MYVKVIAQNDTDLSCIKNVMNIIRYFTKAQHGLISNYETY